MISDLLNGDPMAWLRVVVVVLMLTLAIPMIWALMDCAQHPEEPDHFWQMMFGWFVLTAVLIDGSYNVVMLFIMGQERGWWA